jgi:hypothetical protein
MREIVAIFVLCCVGCGGTASQTTSPSRPQPTVEFSLGGQVQDTALRPVVDVRVEVLEGSRAGEFVMTDASGRYALPGVISGAVTIRAAKDGYVPEIKRYETTHPGQQFLSFSMALDTPSVDLAGDYTLTIIADAACAELPDLARSRTYSAAITHSPPGAPNRYVAVLSGATFYPSSHNDRLYLHVAADFARFSLDPWDDGSSIAEELAPSTYLSIWGVADLSLRLPRISGSLAGTFQSCSGVVTIGNLFRCQAPQARCESASHRVELIRR